MDFPADPPVLSWADKSSETIVGDAPPDFTAALTLISALRAELALARRERDAMLGSTIWRLSGPLRAAMASGVGRPVHHLLRSALGAIIAPSARPEPARPEPLSPHDWYARYRRGADYAAVTWQGSLKISVLMPVYQTQPDWLRAAIDSVLRQTYPHWELVCVDDHSVDPAVSAVLARATAADARVRVVALDQNRGAAGASNAGLAVSSGDYVVFLDHDDMLEPHALARIADAASQEGSDLLYGDEVVTGEDIECVLDVCARPAFSHDFYLSHPYFVHPVAVRLSIARAIGGFDERLSVSQDVDFVLRALEKASGVTHIPDVLYRWRTVPTSLGHVNKPRVMQTSRAVIAAHLARIGFVDSVVKNGPSFNTFDIRYSPVSPARVLAIIPTKNRAALLRACIETVRSTTDGLMLDIVVIDHESDDTATIGYLDDLARAGVAQVYRYQGAFNYSAINNAAVRAYGAGYDHYLFLNNDIEAVEEGWLDAMLDRADRSDVGAIGATLLYPDRRVQHAGVLVGLNGAAEHANKTVSFGSGQTGYLCSLHATRDYSAVTAACMLVRSDAFASVDGFDERIAVGFNDTDFCLRLVEKEWRVLNSAQAVLIHHESATRGQAFDGIDPHPADSARFIHDHADILDEGDPCFSPLLNHKDPTFMLDPSARFQRSVQYRTVRNVLPGPGRRADDAVARPTTRAA